MRREKKTDFFILLFFTFLFLFYHQVFVKEEINRKIDIFIPKNLNLSQISQLLKAKGVIKRDYLFFFYAKIFSKEKDLKGGYYQLMENMKEIRVLFAFLKRYRIPVWVTIPEGFTIREIGEILEKKGVCHKEDFINYCVNPDVLKRYNIPFASAEGFLFPDSYQFFTNSSPAVVFDKMFRRFWEVYSALKRKYKTKLSDSTIIILASIVEKEAKIDSEKPLIASVFLNRLRKGMRLEACATIQYLLEKRKPKLSKEDLEIPSPYNTYLHKGLPPTPICNPGKSSLAAVLSSPQTNYYYFFTPNGITHIFSKTFEEHRKKIQILTKN